MIWKLQDIPPHFTPVTDDDVDKLDEYMALLYFKNQVEHEIIDVMLAEQNLDDEHPHAIVSKCNMRNKHKNAMLDLEEIVTRIKHFKF